MGSVRCVRGVGAEVILKGTCAAGGGLAVGVAEVVVERSGAAREHGSAVASAAHREQRWPSLHSLGVMVVLEEVMVRKRGRRRELATTAAVW